MRTVGIRELKEHASEVLRRVRNRGDVIEVTYRGRPVARLVPITQSRADAPAPAVWEAWDELTDAISARWPAGTSAVNAVREGRRQL